MEAVNAEKTALNFFYIFVVCTFGFCAASLLFAL
jgi:hypothetical protein